MQRHRILAVAVFLMVLPLSLLPAACSGGGDKKDEPDLARFFPPTPATAPTDAAATPTPPDASLLDLSVAPPTAYDAVNQFFALIAAQRFEDAYRLASLEAREGSDREAFAQRYRDIWSEATITGLTYEIPPPPGDNVAGMDVILRYETALLGPLEERVFAPTRRQPNWVVDWSPDLIFVGLAERGSLVHRFIEVPARGRILDRNGAPLAVQGEQAVVGVSHDLIADEDAVIRILTETLEMEEETVRDLVFQDVPSYFFIPVAVLPLDTDPALIEELDQLADQGILVQFQSRRVYPQGDLAAHLVGFLAEINEEELATLSVAGYQPGDLVGRDGAEAIFETALAGERGGRLTIIGPTGEVRRVIAEREATPARDIYLSIDVRVQRIAEATLGEQAGAAVAMDLATHQILAMASYPRFNPNDFVMGLTEEQFREYFENDLLPFVNRPAEKTYPPGSTFKVVTLAAALESGGFDVEDRINCPAIWTGLGPETPLHNWKDEDQGMLSLSQALAQSCNPVFYEIGVKLHAVDENLLTEFASGFGFGKPTGVIGIREVAGTNPGPDWKRVHENDFWYTGDSVNLSIGQGALAATPLQITNAYAALATDGILRTPIGVESIRTAEGEVVQTFHASPIDVLPVSAETLAYLRRAAREVIASPSGTGWLPFAGSPLLVAGKSGTAEDLGEQSHALFVAYANTTSPRAAVTVVLDDGESGADEAGPIVREILEWILLGGLLPPLPASG